MADVPAVVTPIAEPAPLVEVVMYNLLGANWKSTAQGFLSFLALNGASAAVGVQAFGAGHPKVQEWTTGVALGITAVSGIAKWYIGTKEMDAKA